MKLDEVKAHLGRTREKRNTLQAKLNCGDHFSHVLSNGLANISAKLSLYGDKPKNVKSCQRSLEIVDDYLTLIESDPQFATIVCGDKRGYEDIPTGGSLNALLQDGLDLSPEDRKLITDLSTPVFYAFKAMERYQQGKK